MPKKGHGWIWNTELGVVGLRFRFKEGERRALAKMVDKRGPITGIRLVREPDNKYDENAIRVYLPERIMGGNQLGYLHRQTAELLAPKLDSGSLVVKTAELTELNVADGYSTGTLIVTFQDKPKGRDRPKAATKTAT